MPEQLEQRSLSPWEEQVGIAYHAYLLAERRMEEELEYPGVDYPRYKGFDDPIRAIFNRVRQNPEMIGAMDSYVKLPTRKFRTSWRGLYTFESQYAGLFPRKGGLELYDPDRRFYLPQYDELVIIKNEVKDFRLVPHFQIGLEPSDDEFIGVESLHRQLLPKGMKIIKFDEAAGHEVLTSKEISKILLDLLFNLSDKYGRQDDRTEQAIEWEKEVKAILEARSEEKENARLENGHNLAAKVHALEDILFPKVRPARPYDLKTTHGSHMNEIEIDEEDDWRYDDRFPYNRDARLFYLPKERKLAVGDYTRTEPNWWIKFYYTHILKQKFYPWNISLDTSTFVDAPVRYWCVAAPLIVGNLMNGLNNKTSDLIEQQFTPENYHR